MRCRNRSPYRSMVPAMRWMSVASSPRPMMFDMIRIRTDDCHSLTTASSGCKRRAGPALVCRALAPVRRPPLHDARLAARVPRRTATDAAWAAGRGVARRRRGAPRPRSTRSTAPRSSSGAPATRRAAAAAARRRHHRVGRSGARARDPDGRLRAAADRRSRDRRRRGGARRLARPGRARAAESTVARARARVRQRAGRPDRRGRTVDRRRAATKSGEDVRDAFRRGGLSSGAARALVSRRAATSAATGCSTAGRRRATSSLSRGRAGRQHPFARRSARRPSRICSARTAATAKAPAGSRPPFDARIARDGIAPDESRRSVTSARRRRPSRRWRGDRRARSSARPTCSKVTRPISCASRRAFACSGCSPAFFTL